MAPPPLFKKIVSHQLSLIQSMREEFKEHLTEELSSDFADNETWLLTLQTQKEISSSDLERAQRMWENVLQALERAQVSLTQDRARMPERETLHPHHTP